MGDLVNIGASGPSARLRPGPEQQLALARLGAAVAAHDRGGIGT